MTNPRYTRPDGQSGITGELAEFAASIDLEDINADTRRFGVDLLLDTVASALAGTHALETAKVDSFSRRLAGEGNSTVIGGQSMSAAGAVLTNGYEITAVTICDVHKPLLCHVTPEVVPPALAMAEHTGASGRDLLGAVIVGAEVAIRVGLGLNYSEFRGRGWHSPGVIGPFGGAASAGRILGLDAEAMRNALGVAGSQAAGSFAAWGTPTLKFHQSRGALSGLIGALLASEGLAASPDILAHRDGGLLFTHSDGGNPEEVVDRLGELWHVNELTLRRWPLSSGFQSLVSAMLEVLEAGHVTADEVDHVEIALPSETFEMYSDFPWDTKFQAHLSPRFVASVLVHERKCWLEQFDDSMRRDEQIGDFARNRISIVEDASMPGQGAHVRLAVTGGSVHESRCDVALGDPENPLRRSDIIEKFHDARRGIFDDDRAERILATILDIENVDDASELIRSLGRQ